MDRVEKCLFCGRTSPEADLVAWFVQNERRTTHGACWIEAYRNKRLSAASPADSGGAPRKTLDDIRRELQAEYEGVSGVAEPEATETLVTHDDDRPAVERHRPVARGREPRRRYAVAAALGGGAAMLLLVVGHVAATREPVRPNALVERGPRDVELATAAALVELEGQLKALRSDLQGLAERLERSDSRIAGMESRVGGMESSMRRLADDAATAAASRQAERSVAPPRQAATKPASVAPPATASTPAMASDSERWIPAEHPVRVSSPAPREIRPVAELVTAATTEPAAPPAPRAVPEVRASFRDKLRADWRTIKQGVASAGDEFKAAMRDVARKVRGD